jgi:hypothetical protein
VKKKYAKIINDLEKELKKIELENMETLIVAELCTSLIKTHIKEVRGLVLTNGFKFSKDEIYFFKNVKPLLVSKLVYYVEIFKIENYRPKVNAKLQRKYLLRKMKYYYDFIEEYIEFYQYYKTNEKYSDEEFFLRNNKSIRTQFDRSDSYVDDDFTTSLDSIFSKFMAYDLLIKHLQYEIDKLSLKVPNENIIVSNLTWTGPKVGLIEIIYAMAASKVINNGNIDIKEIASTFEKLFKINLGDYYHSFMEIRHRKRNNTKFLDLLKLNLKKRINQFEQ